MIELYLEAGDANKALAAAQRIQSTYRSGWSTIFFAMWFPRSFYLMGKAYERLGDKPAALQAYGKFLALWKQADPGLQELEDARARAAALRRLVRE